jgi:uncharacterized RDD family membrane protein YckC
LSGPGAAGDNAARDPQEWPGERLGLPKDGPGSVASRGVRLVALLLDFAFAALLTSFSTPMDITDPEVMRTFNYWAIVMWFVVSVFGVSVFGFTPGMASLRIRVARIDGAMRVGPLRAIPRAIMIAVIIPAAIVDADGRGLHDRAVGTIVLRTR